MRRVVASAALGAFLLAATSAFANMALMTPTGLGGLQIGWTFDQLRRLTHLDSIPPVKSVKPVGDTLVVELDDSTFKPTGDELQFRRVAKAGACEQYRIQGIPYLLLTFQDGVLTRVRNTAPRSPTTEWVAIGDHYDQVRRAYPQARPDPATPARPGRVLPDLYVWDSDGNGMRFEFNTKGRVFAISAGTDVIRQGYGCP